jgi:sortase (surface protein transpeptidase)
LDNLITFSLTIFTLLQRLLLFNKNKMAIKTCKKNKLLTQLHRRNHNKKTVKNKERIESFQKPGSKNMKNER